MAKLNVNAAIAAYNAEVIENREIAREIRHQSHPFYGLFDGNEKNPSLTRYRLNEVGQTFIPREWVEAYTLAGGNFDSCGHRGALAVFTKWDSHVVDAQLLLDPTQFGRFNRLTGRADNEFGQCYYTCTVTGVTTHQEGVSAFLNAFTISETCDYHTLAVAWRGFLIRRHLTDFGIEVPQTLLTLGRWSQEKVDTLCTSKGYPTDPQVCRDISTALDFSKYQGTLSPRIAHLVRCGEKHSRRMRSEWRTEKTPRYIDAANLTASMFNKYYALTDGCNYSLRRFSANYMRLVYRSQNTNAGQLVEVKGALINRSADGNPSYIIKQTGSMSVCMVKNAWEKACSYFVWSTELGFEDHIESSISLRDAMEKYAKRNGNFEGGISLEDVRNDISGTLGYCLGGTKSFLAERMPYLYHLVKRYSSWSDVPSDIMQAKWELADPQTLFKGFRNPFSKRGGE